MSRFLRKFFTAMSVSVLLLTTACAVNPPVQEMSNARQSIQAAVDAGAETLAGDELAEARALLEEASTRAAVPAIPATRASLAPGESSMVLTAYQV